jgi:hypothetical protein
VSGDQLVVLALLVIAFGVGWVARGDGRTGRGGTRDPGGRPDRAALRALVGEAVAALDRAVVACSAARAMAAADAATRAVALDVLSGAAAELGPVAQRLAAELGADHPLTEELRDGAMATGLVESWLADGAPAEGTEAALALERAARDARSRSRRLEAALGPVLR